ncbi:hypothetical protein LY474_34530 [Myxococcus stipitatus]|uniref:hypothetical protein n=1 Tax=Myxococcus stipitatus TaxID=83455 RepID=UPI001F236E9A|nr:hypothetical protein [Myxococcus stipitatus]MCE9672936.1 hypothetical protein [Myxococcus stipitatus]
MGRGNLDNHRRILGICFILTNALSLVAAVFAFGAFSIGSSILHESTPTQDLTLFWLLAGLGVGCLLLMGLPGIIAGVGLLKRRRWSRLLSLIVGAIGLTNVPFGTLLGIYAIWFYVQPGSERVLE